MTNGKKKTAKKCLDANGKFEGYKFEEDDIANQMAYLFAGEEGEKEAARILTEANEKFGEPLQVGERRDFIKGEVKRKAASVDNNFQSGLMDIFNTLKDKNQPCSGEEAGKEVAFNLMKGLGLNVDKDNLQTQYDPGPPQIFMITWVNRPGENLANKDSSINKLAEAYSNTLKPETQERKAFDKSWKEHTANAAIGGPKIDKDQFLAESKQLFDEYKAEKQLGEEKGLTM